MMKRRLMLLGAVFVGLALSETLLRLTLPVVWLHMVKFGGYTWLTYDPVLGWENRANFDHRDFHINGLRFRGDEVSLRKPAGSLRIICLGDSRTFGIRQEGGDTIFDNDYPSHLKLLLESDAAYPDVEVLNAGVIGYASAHGLRQLATQLLELEPDIIVVGFGFNEAMKAWSSPLRDREPRGTLLRQLLYGWHDWGILQLGLAVYQGVAALSSTPLTEPWVLPGEYAYDLRRFAQISRENGIHLLLLSQALRPLKDVRVSKEDEKRARVAYALFGARDLPDFYRIHAVYQGILYQAAAKGNIPLADAARAFAEHHGEPLFGPDDLAHPNPAGARLIAATVHRRLRELGWQADSTHALLHRTGRQYAVRR